MTSKLTGRASDNLTVEALRLRSEGRSVKWIGRHLGTSAGNIVIRTNRVRDEEMAAATSDAERAEIAGAYW